METFFYDLFDESDDVLANFPMPVSEKSEVESICTNSVFNNCIINCVVNKVYVLSLALSKTVIRLSVLCRYLDISIDTVNQDFCRRIPPPGE